MPHSLRDVELPSAELPSSASPASPLLAIDIKLRQDRNQVFSPGSIVSGFVIAPGNDKLCSLIVEFFGRSTTSFYAGKSDQDPGPHYADDAILFSYQRPLNQLYRPGDQWVRDSHWGFEFRFPSSTENRRTVFFKQELHGSWTDAVHSLPPSLEHSSSSCTFSIEYILRARAYVDKRLVAETELLLQFVPRTTVLHSAPSPLLPCSPKTLFTPTHQAIDSTSDAGTLALFRSRSFDGSSAITIHQPFDLVSGQTFSIRAEIRFEGLSKDWDLVASSIQVHVEMLQLFSSTHCRGHLVQNAWPTLTQHENARSVTETVIFDTRRTIDTIRPVSDDTFAFFIEARLPDNVPASFISFIISNKYDLHGRIVATAGKRMHRMFFFMPDVQVVPPARQTLPGKRTSQAALLGPAPVRRR